MLWLALSSTLVVAQPVSAIATEELKAAPASPTAAPQTDSPTERPPSDSPTQTDVQNTSTAPPNTPSPGEAAPALRPALRGANPVYQPLTFGYHYAAGAAATLVAVPGSLYLGQWLGSLSNNLIVAALPVLLSIGLIPPVAVTLATVLAGNWNEPGKYRWWPAFLATLVINAGSLALAATFGLSVGVVGRVVVYTLVQAVLQPTAAVALERAWPRTPATSLANPGDSVSPRTHFVPTGSWSF